MSLASGLPWIAWCLLVGIVVIRAILASRRPKGFPPGPPTIPFLGNLSQIPLRKAFLKWDSWTEQYGTIVGLKFGTQNVVILNHYKHVKELFDKRGALYSSRPENFIGNELICPRNVHILLLPYGEDWRKQRKVVQALLNLTAVNHMLPVQSAEASQTLMDLCYDPEGYYDHIRRYSTAVILATVFGQRGARFNSPKVQALYHAQDRFTAILEPGAAPPVDAFPFLRYLPDFMAPWKREARAIRQEQSSLYFALLNETKSIAQERHSDCFMAKLLAEQEKHQLDDEHLAYLGGILMEAGSDTTASTLLNFILALTKYPNVLIQAQKEIDMVCGDKRSPSIEDLDELPYLSACLSEVLRWRPVAAGGIPHVLIQDDVYEGYVLPKGTILFANTWAINRSKEEYNEPDEFIPKRFLNNKFGTINLATADDDHRRVTYGFGAGRRVCPGQRLAENSLKINMAKIVWAFNITAGASDVNTNIETAYTDGFLTAPAKFPVRFTPRSEKHKLIIEEEFESVKPFLARFTQDA
ncbi:cytochrome P450 [Xylogone sp. PMI_703]|nr:cytochrome P450 [Xylogone sp. PMI_703]